MKKITCDEKLDKYFLDDRDARIESFAPDKRVPSYGANDLKPPKRALTPAEIAVANRIGTEKE